jgi:hypothetical protein
LHLFVVSKGAADKHFEYSPITLSTIFHLLTTTGKL